MSEGLIIGIVSAIGASTITLVSQQLKWIHDKRKFKHENRRLLLNDCREYLGREKFDQDHFSNGLIYSRLKPYFGESLIKEIENRPTTIKIVLGSSRDVTLRNNILDRLAVLEKEWDLI